MHILYLHQYFTTDKHEGGTRSYEFAKFFVKQGHDVTMITSGLLNEEFPVPPRKKFVEKRHAGIRVVSIAAGYADARKGTSFKGWHRMVKFLQFAKLASKIGEKFTKPDIVFATHTPLPIGLAGMRLSQFYNVPFIFEVRDLWPDALINLGALKNPLIINWMRRMERKIYRAANHIIALSPGMKEGIVRSGISNEKVTVIPNGCDVNLFCPDIIGNNIRDRFNMGNRFVAIYFGAMGMANGLDYVLDAAKILKERKNEKIVIILHGDGGKRNELEGRVEREALNNVVFSDPVAEKQQLAQIVADCNVCLTIYRSTKEKTWSPNKMFDSLSAGKPVIINVDGWLGDTITDNDCGKMVHPSNPCELADALEEFAKNPDKCKAMGKNARTLAEKEFARDILAQKLEDIFISKLNLLKIENEFGTKDDQSGQIKNCKNVA